MNILYSLLLLFSMVASAVGRRQCYQCSSTTSWSDCESRESRVTCRDSTYDDCGKLKVKITSKITGKEVIQYHKGCTQTCMRDRLKGCQDTSTEFRKCLEYHCCGTDYCNVRARKERQCYHCSSFSSWADCQSRLEKTTCKDSSYADCAKLKITTTSTATGAKTTQYFRGCTQTCVKNDLAVCKNTVYSTKNCEEYHCCGSDYCSAGSRLTGGLTFGILTFAAAATAVFTSKMMM